MLAVATCLSPVTAWGHVIEASEGPETSAASLPLPTDPLPSPVVAAAVTPAGWDLDSLPSTTVNPAISNIGDFAESEPTVPFSVAHNELADPGLSAPDSSTLTGPAAPQGNEARRWSDHVPRRYATHSGFWEQAGTVKTETLLFLGYFALTSSPKLFKETKPFHFKNEGWFGKDTDNIGVDKLTHAFNTYLIAEILHDRIHDRTNASEGDAITAAVLASGMMALNEISDGIEADSGYSMQDIAMNLAGAGFSVLRNTVPGMKEKLAFKLEIIPNSRIYSHRGKPHYAQQRFMLSLKGAGFKEFDRTPLRYIDLQVGYYASDFEHKHREAGIEPKRHLFVGLGLNVGELFFGKSRSGVGKAAHSVLDYLQLPYTSLRYDTTGRLGN